MYKSVKLNRESIEILKYLKKKVLKDEGVNTTYSNILNDICADIVDLNIDWRLVRKTPSDLMKSNNNNSEVISVNLSSMAIKNLKNFIIKDINKQLDLKKPHFNFLLNMILRAFYINIQN